MPETAKWIVGQAQFPSAWSNDLENSEINIAMGTWYLRTLIRDFNQNHIMALAAYNAGPGNVQRWINEGIWDGRVEDISNIPFGETRHYLRKVIYYQERYHTIYNGREL